MAKLKSTIHSALIKGRNKILKKLKKFIISIIREVKFSLCKVKDNLTFFTLFKILIDFLLDSANIVVEERVDKEGCI